MELTPGEYRKLGSVAWSAFIALRYISSEPDHWLKFASWATWNTPGHLFWDEEDRQRMLTDAEVLRRLAEIMDSQAITEE